MNRRLNASTYIIFRIKLLMNLGTAPAFSLSKSLKKCKKLPYAAISEMSDHNPIVPGPIYNVAGLGARQPSLSHSIGKSKRMEINHRV